MGRPETHHPQGSFRRGLSAATVDPHAHPKRRRWLTQAEAAEYLKVTDRTLRRMVAAGDLPAYRLGPRLLRIDQADLDALLRRVPTAGGGRIA